MIVEFTRAHIRMTFEEKTVTVGGEGLLPGFDSPDFVIYSNTITHFDAPDFTPIDAPTRARILDELARLLIARNTRFKIE